MYDKRFMRRAIQLSAEALTKTGAEPFGAVVVKDGEIIGEGMNQSLARLDPTSHGEVEAIRAACHRVKSVDLSGCELYTSCEPCAMCVATMGIVRISNMYYAASMTQAEDEFTTLTATDRHSVDPDFLRSEAGAKVDDRCLKAVQKMECEALSILKTWVSQKKA